MVALVLAGGASTRFGGKNGKQLTAVDPAGNTLLDYAIFDAYSAGVNKAVVVTSESNYAQMAQTVGVRIGRKLSVTFAVQTPPAVYGFGTEHRPLGTGHAFLCGAQHVKEPFVVLNADDFYGRAAIGQAVALAEAGKCGCVYYPAGQTVGATPVHRGIALIDGDRLTGICECTFARDAEGKLYAEDDTCRKYLPERTPVNMNLYAMQPSITATAAKCFARFLEEGKNAECLLGDVVSTYVGDRRQPVYAVKAKSRWYGVTYREDLRRVIAHIAQLRRAGIYPADLWA